MANTMVLISAVTVGAGGAASIDFTSIPSTYTDLVVKLSVRADAAYTRRIIGVKFNGSTTTSDYSVLDLRTTDGSTVNASLEATSPYMQTWDTTAASATSSTFASVDYYISNYSSSSQYKAVNIMGAAENNATGATVAAQAGLYKQNTTVSSLAFAPGNGNWVQYSTAYLYGISKS